MDVLLSKISKFKKPLALFAVALFALLFSSFTLAGTTSAVASSGSASLFSLPSAASILNPNTSVHILYQLFGPLIDSILGASSTSDPSEFLFALMLMHWNYILITGCAMFFIYHLVLGIFKSAEHGKFMGNDGDKGATITRLVVGPFIMVPAIKGGFCAAQYMIMTLILCGVHLANYVWSQTTNDIKMGATPTIPDGVTSTLNNVAAQMYEYSVLDKILSSGDTKVLPGKPITPPATTGLVLLQNYPALESVGHALLSSGSYLKNKSNKSAGGYVDAGCRWDNNTEAEQGTPTCKSLFKVCNQAGLVSDGGGWNQGYEIGKETGDSYALCTPGNKANLATYQPGEWLVSGVEFNRDGTPAYSTIANGTDFETDVLKGAGHIMSDSMYNNGSATAVPQTNTNQENPGEAALIAPLGFDLVGMASDWTPPILAQSGSPLYIHNEYTGTDYQPVTSPNAYDVLQDFRKNIPLYQKFPMFSSGFGSYDCRKLIGQSTPQNYNIVAFDHLDVFSGASAGAKLPMPSLTKGVAISDPDQQYKACLMNQAIYRECHLITPKWVSPTGGDTYQDNEAPQFYPPYVSVNVITHDADSSAASSLGLPGAVTNSVAGGGTVNPADSDFTPTCTTTPHSHTVTDKYMQCQINTVFAGWKKYYNVGSDWSTANQAACWTACELSPGITKCVEESDTSTVTDPTTYSCTCNKGTKAGTGTWTKIYSGQPGPYVPTSGSTSNTINSALGCTINAHLAAKFSTPEACEAYTYDYIISNQAQYLAAADEYFNDGEVKTETIPNGLNSMPNSWAVTSTALDYPMDPADTFKNYMDVTGRQTTLGPETLFEFARALQLKGYGSVKKRIDPDANNLMTILTAGNYTGLNPKVDVENPYPQKSGMAFFQGLQTWLGYGPNLTLFNNYMDLGQLLKDDGHPTYPKGQLQVYTTGTDGNFHYGQGLLTATSSITINSSGFGSAVQSGVDKLQGDNIRKILDLKKWADTTYTSGQEVIKNPGKKITSTIDWSDFVKAVLAAAAPSVDASKNMYVPGSGYYQTDNRGFLVNSSGEEVWTKGEDQPLLDAIAGSGAVTYHTSGASPDTGWMVKPANTDHWVPLGIPQCGPGYTSGFLQGKAYGTSSGVTEPFGKDACDLLSSGVTSGFITATNDYCGNSNSNSNSHLLGPGGTDTGGASCTFLPLTSFFGGSSNVSWWNVGRSYLMLNQQLAANVQALVNNINNTLTKAKIAEALQAVQKPFSSGGFVVKQSQNMKFNVKLTGSIGGTLALTYVPSSQAIPGAASPYDNGTLTQPLSRNFLMLAVENKAFVKSANGSPSGSLQHNGLSQDGLINDLNSLPDNLLKPFEYLALYYRISVNKANYINPLPTAKQTEMIAYMSAMVATLKHNGLISDDAAPASSTSAKMFSSISSALSSVYQHITPQQVGGDSLTYINPLQIENVLQSLYSFGGASGSLGSSNAMIGKQYDFLTQIQQIGINMVGDVVSNLYDIGNAYTNTFNNNEALIDGNLTSVNNGYAAIVQQTNSGMAEANRIVATAPGGGDPDNLRSKYEANTPSDAELYGGIYGFTEAGIEAAAAMGVEGSRVAGTGPGTADFVGLVGLGMQGWETSIKIRQAKNQNIAAEYSETMQKANTSLLNSQLTNQNSMINMQEKMIDLQKMSYQMSVNLIKAMMMLPLAFVVLTMMFTAGIQFALIIPMTPYIIFWAGQTSWVLNSIEAMVAAPLLGFALLLPGGHGQYGHSIPAVRMLLNVVLKPVLMVFGVIASMVLIYIVVVYSAQGFHMMGDSIVGTFFSFNYGTGADGVLKNADQVTNVRAILSLMLIFMYATFLQMVFNKCFSAIYLIPEKVVQWLGGQSDSFGKEEAQQMSQATQQQAGQVAQAGQQSMQNVAGGAKEMTGAKSQEASSVEGSDMQMAGSQNSRLGTEQGINSSSDGQSKAMESESGSQSAIAESAVGGMQGAGSIGKATNDMNNELNK